MNTYEDTIKYLLIEGIDGRFAYPLFKKYGGTALRILGSIAVDSRFGEENIYLNSSYNMETTTAESIRRIWQGEKRLDCDRAGIETFLEGVEASHGYALTSE